jgi:hypothetical protein
MRDNGVPSFPDPVNGSIGRDNLKELGIDPESTEFKEAAKKCESALGEPVQRPSPSADPNGGSAWEKIVPGGDCMCADGSQFAFWVRDADPTKVVFWLDGGGACWDATTCAFTGGDTYSWNVSPEDAPTFENGIFDLADAANPLADYTFVYVPYCTGDVHLGDQRREYSPELTVEHRGFVNGTTAMAFLTEHYPNANQIVVIGESAGSLAAPVYAGLVSDALPDARITAFGDSSGAYPDDPDINARIGAQWGSFGTMPDWDVNGGLTARDWGIRRFWIQAGLHDSDIVMARFDHAFDAKQAARLSMLNVSFSSVIASIDANEAAIEAAGVVQHSYTAPGTDHGILARDGFYTLSVDGITLVEWVEALIAGEPLGDVCMDERGCVDDSG